MDLSRDTLKNQFVIYAYHASTFLPIIWLNFGNNLLQLVAVSAIILLALIVIHSLRANYGIVSSIAAQMIFNFSVFILLCTIYYSDILHKGYTAEKHTTLRKNCVDFIFGQNEDYELNE